MIGELRSFIITICTAVIFITAVEMILPSNSFKKYAKFVLGLILITVLINPIIKIFDKGFDFNEYVNQATKYVDSKEYDNTYSKYKNDSMTKTLDTFKLNLESAVQAKLKDRFPKNNYAIEAQVAYDDQNDSVYVKSLKVGVKDGTINPVKKVVITTKGNVENLTQSLNDERSRLIKEYLSGELKLAANSIEVYKN
ncbi:stage III sporulation protein AF [Clostridium swellfunianum]|uniref:stage III sporulation protein AF n=1 Tax=Clostridium swellfunianum TaxID=1367462 RepID=UPI00202FC303|nr:stage III sporulation protein AF [Clostridium swellfunianum]MCM0650374.1 stage III sporulation protein AF [Clostridium swellfunianum]